MAQHHWSWNAEVSDAAQHLRLLQNYMQEYEGPQAREDAVLDYVERPLPRVPSPDEIKTILEPWRSAKVRHIAKKCYLHNRSQIVWLRTHYGVTKEEEALLNLKFCEMVDTISEDDLESDDDDDDDDIYCVLNDPGMFDFGEDWARVIEVVPELIKPINRLRHRLFDRLDERDLPRIRTDLKTEIQNAAEDRGAENLVHNGVAVLLQRCAVQSFIVVADEEALRSGTFKVYWFDGRGNKVRSSRITPDRVRTLHLQVIQGRWPECEDMWTNGLVGSQYQLDGPLRQEVYGL
ncbi:hypothetical protein B9Z65_7244 [Elsinoe australis]|uniref:Uncharacterized protein n=1 Tax=Elsinoe australis TaxID=40998 RepID=A0A2P7Z671_9PEZI|nr:hypothetical protein B9Z65_7244 [Elsinoe australis]